MNIERAFRILWGPTLENVLDFMTPVAGTAPTFFREPRDHSEQVPSGAIATSWITGRYYRMTVQARWFGAPQNFGANGLQAFIDWASDSNTFTLVPNTAMPQLTVTGCYLEGPFTDLNPSAEQGEVQQLELTILHPSSDLSLAWRGLFFEYDAGQNLLDPAKLNFARASSLYEITPAGYLLSNPTDDICDGHYPDRVGGIQTTLFQPAITNDVTNPEDLANASWAKAECTITANNAKAPDQNVTADLVVESVTASAIHICTSASYAITAGDVLTGVAFLRDGGRGKCLIHFQDAGAQDVRCGLDVDLSTGTIANFTIGTGTVLASNIIPLAGGWYMVWWRGKLDPTLTTSVAMRFRLKDNSGNATYTGDGASGMYFWGGTAVHGANQTVYHYVPTTSARDFLRGNTTVTPQTAQWIYIQGIEAGSTFAPAGQFPSLLILGQFGAVWRTIIDMNQVVTGRYSINNGTNTVSVSADCGAAAPAVGQAYELLALVYPDQSVKIIQSIAGGAETSSGQSAAPATVAPAAYPLVSGFNTFIGDTGYNTAVFQFAGIKVGAFVPNTPHAVDTIAKARAV